MVTLFASRTVDLGNMFGGGHTMDTDPTLKGWRVQSVWNGRTVMIGRKNKLGCATDRRVGGEIDVAIYTETPEEVIANRGCDPSYNYHTPDTPGFGLEILRRIEAELVPPA